MVDLLPGVDVTVDIPRLPEVTAAPPGITTTDVAVDVLPSPLKIEIPAFPEVESSPPRAQESVIVPIAGPPGPPGQGVFDAFEYQMPTAQTTAIIDHDLERDPVAIQVFDGPIVCSEYSVTFTIPGEQVLIGFDVSIAAFIRLL